MFGFFRKTNKTEETANTIQLHYLMQMLDHSDNMVMLADTTPDNTIFYMNRTARQVLSQHRSMMNEKFRPGVDVENAFKHSIHQFHKDPDRIRKILADLASRRISEHAALIPVGDIFLETKVYPIWDEKNPQQVACFMASFLDVSARVRSDALAKENTNRKQFLESRVNEISLAMQQMSSTIRQVASQSSSASDSSEIMLRETKSGVAIVKHTSESMSGVASMVRMTADNLESLGHRSETIGQIVNVIKDIADQTNLLALNAAIEAARAGETGRGFAVVADEVRKLAERTTNATQEIGGMIGEIQKEVRQNVATIEDGRKQVAATEEDFIRAEQALDTIYREINQMRDFILQMAKASDEQAVTTQDIADKIASIAAN